MTISNKGLLREGLLNLYFLVDLNTALKTTPSEQFEALAALSDPQEVLKMVQKYGFSWRLLQAEDVFAFAERFLLLTQRVGLAGRQALDNFIAEAKGRAEDPEWREHLRQAYIGGQDALKEQLQEGITRVFRCLADRQSSPNSAHLAGGDGSG